MTRKVKCKDGAAVVIGVAQGTMSVDDEDVEDDEEDDKESHPHHLKYFISGSASAGRVSMETSTRRRASSPHQSSQSHAFKNVI
mmetsp:Transcript_37986/g.90926  ORF Transcript_37986/g.90926 Transcript_37986/m.90926 type:complete len:84 (-) Transcript_37986:296-547(-)